MLGYTLSLMRLNDNILAVLSLIATTCLLVPQYFYLNNMPILNNIVITSLIWFIVSIIVGFALLYTGEIYDITLVNKIICYYTCPR
jgi:hypothetical protein